MKALLSQSVPQDASLPALTALNADGPNALLERSGIVAAVERISVLKHHRGERMTLLLETSSGRMVLKAFLPDPSPQIELMHELAARGLASGSPPTAAPLLGFDRSLRFLVFQWLGGPRAGEIISQGGGRRGGEVGAAWLQIVPSIDIALGEVWGQKRMDREIRRWAAKIEVISPSLGRQAYELAARLAATYPAPERYVLSHGSFSHSHVFDMGAGPGLVDWDSFCRAPIELDAGRFLANLTRLVLAAEPVWWPEAAEASREFRSGIAEVTDPRAVEWYRAAKQLKISMHLATRRRTGWQERCPVILEDAMLALRDLR
jgi:phosphotransferase family enzyme